MIFYNYILPIKICSSLTRSPSGRKLFGNRAVDRPQEFTVIPEKSLIILKYVDQNASQENSCKE